MSAPVDVLAVLRSLNLADPSQRPDLTRAIAGLRELIAERDALLSALQNARPIILHTAAGRRGMKDSAALALPQVQAALARVQGGGK